MTNLSRLTVKAAGEHVSFVPGRRVFSSLNDFENIWLIPPGETIEELLTERGWTQVELAVRTGFSDEYIEKLLKGNSVINEEAALTLERVLGSTAQFWMRLETQYREQMTRCTNSRPVSI